MRAAMPAHQSTLLTAALIAAHGASHDRRGFRMTDVRFFFYLFANWLELDLLRSTPPLELTQIRRRLAQLVAEGRAARGDGRRYALTSDGLAALADVLTTEAAERSFEEALFAACFARCYGPAVLARTRGAARAKLAKRLSVARVLAAAERRVERIIADLDARVQSSAAMQAEARALRGRGLDDAALAAALDRHDAYQLQHVRSFAEVMRALPPDLVRFELDLGLAVRSELLFAPLAAQARAQRAILAKLRAALDAGATT
jgi:hypothetical protein